MKFSPEHAKTPSEALKHALDWPIGDVENAKLTKYAFR